MLWYFGVLDPRRRPNPFRSVLPLFVSFQYDDCILFMVNLDLVVCLVLVPFDNIPCFFELSTMIINLSTWVTLKLVFCFRSA